MTDYEESAESRPAKAKPKAPPKKERKIIIHAGVGYRRSEDEIEE